METREDIGQAYLSLDGKGQNNITGMGASRVVKKAFQSLPDFLSDELVLALASALDPPVHAGEQRQLGAAGSLSAISQTAKSGRLLVVTESNLWEVRAGGRLNGSRPEGVRIALSDITDVRVWSGRRGLGAKERHLSVDFMRGAMVETRVHVLASDVAIQHLGSTLVGQVQNIQSAIATDARQASGSSPSIADELAKLAALRDSADLTAAEYDALKASLLKGHSAPG